MVAISEIVNAATIDKRYNIISTFICVRAKQCNSKSWVIMLIREVLQYHIYHTKYCCEVNIKLMVVKHARKTITCSATDIQHYRSKCLTQEETE